MTITLYNFVLTVILNLKKNNSGTPPTTLFQQTVNQNNFTGSLFIKYNQSVKCRNNNTGSALRLCINLTFINKNAYTGNLLRLKFAKIQKTITPILPECKAFGVTVCDTTSNSVQFKYNTQKTQSLCTFMSQYLYNLWKLH